METQTQYRLAHLTGVLLVAVSLVVTGVLIGLRYSVVQIMDNGCRPVIGVGGPTTCQQGANAIGGQILPAFAIAVFALVAGVGIVLYLRRQP